LLAAAALAGDQGGAGSGGWRLAAESSPYLRMHSTNPVEWYPWGAAAFAAAREQNRPLFISIGYFTCHWCHVMERESFSNPGIAALLNDNFISIKVDREQRPDVDAAYMSYVTATRGRGGWPMSVWATPDGKPFLGGTYFPPEAGPDHTGMRQILTQLAELWREDPEGIRETAELAVAMLQDLETSAEPLPRLTKASPDAARAQYRGSFDEFHGGFSQAPKFPQPAILLFLLQDENRASASMALHTLDRMAEGGIHDHLEGGFHRYSTDYEWRVPHFEKMLYDQALIARACLVAYRQTREEKYARLARRIIDFSLQHMRDPKGGFYSALSADSLNDAAAGHMEEGAYYTWSWRQLTDALGKGELRGWAAARYGIREQGNALSDPVGELAGRNVLYLAENTRMLAEKFNVDLITAARRNQEVDRLLLAARKARPPVPVDDKIVTVWNGYMVTTLAMAGQLLKEPAYLQAARETADFLYTALYDAQDRVLYRDWRHGKRGVPGFGEDYAAFAEGLLGLYTVTGRKALLQRARQLADIHLAGYWDRDRGGFFRTRKDSELWIREKNAEDGATLSDNGIAVHVLLELAQLTGEEDYRSKAWQTAAWAGAQMEAAPAAMPYALIRWPELMDEAGKGQAGIDRQRH